MVRVLEIYDEAKKIVGNSSDDYFFAKLTDAVELLSIKGDFDPNLGTLDVDVHGDIVTLPPEVETILACNVAGNPAVARDELFSFHINGPGTRHWGREGGIPLRWEWMDLPETPTYRGVTCPSQVVAYCLEPDDVNAELWVHGFDNYNNVVRSKNNEGVWVDGYRVPIFQNVIAIDSNAPYFSRFTVVQKQPTAGPIRFSTVGGRLLGVYQARETTPKYRQIKLSRCSDWIRIKYRRRNFRVESKYDLLPVNNRQSVLMMLKAMKEYDNKNVPLAEALEATAVRWMTEKQFTSNPPVVQPIEVVNQAPVMDPWDFMD